MHPIHNRLFRASLGIDDDGFVTQRALFPQDLLRRAEETLTKLLKMQASKLRCRLADPPAFDREIDALAMALDAVDAEALDAAGEMLTHSAVGNALTSHWPFVQACASLLGCDPDLLVISGPSFTANLPSDERRLYSWHS